MDDVSRIRTYIGLVSHCYANYCAKSHLITNYGEKWRYVETISTAFVESTINEVVAKRMVKKQQMQWTYTGAHYILQTRTAVLNGELHKHFSRWFSGFSVNHQDDEFVGGQKAA
jgi:hypothetical protein